MKRDAPKAAKATKASDNPGVRYSFSPEALFSDKAAVKKLRPRPRAWPTWRRP